MGKARKTPREMIEEEIERRGMEEGEFREGDCETGIGGECSRHYESRSVAAKMADGTWIGWTFWYGGGKHGDPRSIPWMEDAYFLDCVEEEKLVTVRTFTKKGSE